MNQQQIVLFSYQPPFNVTALTSSLMTNPTGSSTPIPATTKRGHNDTSGISESNMQLRTQYVQPTRIFNSSNTPNKRLRGVNPQSNEVIYTNQVRQNGPIQPNRNSIETRELVDSNDKEQVPSTAACRFASTRYPFAPFSVIFSQEVREKTVVDGLIKHAFDNSNFELKTVAYRKGRMENNEHRILVFVENNESLVFFYNHSNWPTTLTNCQFTIKSPLTPPHLALVMPSVSLQVDWDEFTQELKGKYPDISNIIRLKNNAQQPLRVVKSEFLSSDLRNEILAVGEISILHMKLKVVEYFSRAYVFICSNCYGIGHFRKNCTQKNEETCKTRGEKSTNLKDHLCSGVMKCIYCGGENAPNDTKCKVQSGERL